MSCFEKRPERWLPKGPVPENDAEPEVRFSELSAELPKMDKQHRNLTLEEAGEQVAIVTGMSGEMTKEMLEATLEKSRLKRKSHNEFVLHIDTAEAQKQIEEAAKALMRMSEPGVDPNGLDQHAPGAKLDAGKLRPGLVFSAFARALEAVALVGTYGAEKYSDNGWLQVPNGVDRYTDALLRHYVAEAKGEWTDSESGLPHAAHLAWNALARLELLLREQERIKTSEQIAKGLQK
jgi:hypothetical protein